MTEITPDLIEWMVADDQVSAKWKQFASNLGLTSYIPTIEARRNKGRGRSDRQRLADILALWKLYRPHTYNVQHLLKLLEKQQMKDMHEWIRLMTGQTLSKAQIESLVIRQVNSSSRPHSVRSELLPSRGLADLGPRPTSQYFSLPTSPRYTPLPSRPLSQLSFLNETTFSNSTRSSVSPRRDVNDSGKHRVQIDVPLEQGSDTVKQNGSPKSTGVFNTLYQPHLLKRTKPTPFSHSLLQPSSDDAKRRPLVVSAQDNKQKRHSSYITDYHYSRSEPLLKIMEQEDSKAICKSNKNTTSRGRQYYHKMQNDFHSSKILALEKQQKNLSAEKYFDNLITLIEEVSSSLEI